MVNDRIIQSVLGASVLLTWVHVARAQCQYDVQPGPPPQLCIWGTTRHFTALGMNNLGAWCGYRPECYPEEGEEGSLPAYCPPGGIPQLLPWPPGTGEDGARATAVNDAGVVVGYYNTSTGIQKGCIWWPNGTVTEIPHSPGPSWFSPAHDINNSNVIVGVSNGPYVLKDGVLTTIQPPPGLSSSACWKISDTGFVTGTFGNPNVDARAFRWRDGDLRLLEPLPGHPISIGSGVNDAGEVVGHSKINLFPQPSIQTPTLWLADGTAVELEMLPGYSRGATGEINNQGVITGSLGADGIPSLPVLWINGTCHPISEVTVPGSPSVGSIVDCNAVGQLISGGVKIMTPVGQSIGDLNGDCAVDGSDLVVVLSEWGPREWSVADINTDGVVDGNDLAVVLGQWTGS